MFQNNYVVPNFNYGMLWYVTISTSSWYESVIGFMENNKDDDDDELNVILVWVALFFHIWEVQVQISGRKLAVLTEGFCGFLLCVQANKDSKEVFAVV